MSARVRRVEERRAAGGAFAAGEAVHHDRRLLDHGGVEGHGGERADDVHPHGG